MKSEQIYVGNIMRCTEYTTHTTFSSSLSIGGEEVCSDSFGYIESKSEIVKENAILIKLKNGGFVDLDNLNNVLDHLKVKQSCTRDGFYLGGLIMSTYAYCKDSLFVDPDEDKLHQYYASPDKKERISTRQFKKQLIKNKNGGDIEN